MSVTDLCVVDTQYRLERKRTTLRESLARRWDWHRKNSRRMLTLHKERYDFIRAELLKPVCEINSLLSSRVSTVMLYVFEGLPKPAKARHSDIEQNIIELMNLKGQRQRAGQHSFALECEIALRAKRKWFMVFNTLTVEHSQYLEVFHDQSTAFKDYIRKIDRDAKRSVYGSVRKAKDQPLCHTYFAVTEEGKQTGRLHIHVLHLLQALPKGCRDPNTGLPVPRLREITRFKRYWPHGHSSPIAIRYSYNDAYGRSGWIWPFDPKTGQGLKTSSPMQVAGYITKYVLKSYASEKRSQLLWRVKKTQRLGQSLLRMLTADLSNPTLAVLANRPVPVRLNNRPIPPHLLRRAALSRLLNRLSSQNRNAYVQAVSPRPGLLTSFRALTAMTPNFNPESSGALASVEHAEGDLSYDDALADVTQRARELDERYFPKTNKAYTAQSARPHI